MLAHFSLSQIVFCDETHEKSLTINVNLVAYHYIVMHRTECICVSHFFNETNLYN